MRILLATVALSAMLVGCAGIPDSGGVHRVNTTDIDSQSTVRYAPAEPVKDANPKQIVSGFLDAMLAYPVTTGVASSFLTAKGAKNWQSSAGVQIYVNPRVGTSTAVLGSGSDNTGNSRVRLSVRTEATLDVQGRYRKVGDDDNFSLLLTKVKGQWRIDNPPDGFLIDRKFFEDYYSPFSLYFFDRPGERLVADPIYLPIGEQLATSMMTSLLRGPGESPSGFARTYIPPETQLQTSVPSRRDGLAEVEFKQDLISLPQAEQERLSAQIVWTLRQVDGISGVRILAAESEINPQGSGAQSLDDWSAFGPPSSPGTFFAIQGNKIVRMSGRSVGVLAGDWGDDARGARSVAVHRSEERLAIVTKDGETLEIGGLSRDAKTVIAKYSGNDFSNPVFDDRGQVWSFDRQDGKTRLRLFSDTRTAQVPVGDLANIDVESFALSPGQSRYAVIGRSGTSTGLYVGDVLVGDKDQVVRLGPSRRLNLADAGLSAPRSIVWENTGSVAFLATKSTVGSQVFRARIDGSSILGGSASVGPLLPDLQATSLALSGGEDPVQYVGDDHGRLWWQSGIGRWQQLVDLGLTAPTYTG